MISLMFLGVGLAYLLFYVIFPFVGWIFNMNQEPTITPPTFNGKTLEKSRERITEDLSEYVIRNLHKHDTN